MNERRKLRTRVLSGEGPDCGGKRDKNPAELKRETLSPPQAGNAGLAREKGPWGAVAGSAGRRIAGGPGPL